MEHNGRSEFLLGSSFSQPRPNGWIGSRGASALRFLFQPISDVVPRSFRKVVNSSDHGLPFRVGRETRIQLISETRITEERRTFQFFFSSSEK